MIQKNLKLFLLLLILVSSTLYSYNTKSITEIKSSEKTSDVIAGVLLNRIDSGDNLILNVYDETDSIYVLVPKDFQSIKVKKGNRLIFSNLTLAMNYEDKVTSKEFDYLLIAKSVINMAEFQSQEDTSKKDDPHANCEEPHDETPSKKVEDPHNKTTVENPHQNSSTAPTPTNVKVNKLENGYTVEELFQKVDELVGKEVKIRATIVKYSPNIMNSNWLHIQDGSGNRSDKTNDLVVVSKETFNKGDVVELKGTLAKDHNLGSGYLYNVIILDAKKIK